MGQVKFINKTKELFPRQYSNLYNALLEKIQRGSSPLARNTFEMLDYELIALSTTPQHLLPSIKKWVGFSISPKISEAF